MGPGPAGEICGIGPGQTVLRVGRSFFPGDRWMMLLEKTWKTARAILTAQLLLHSRIGKDAFCRRKELSHPATGHYRPGLPESRFPFWSYPTIQGYSGLIHSSFEDRISASNAEKNLGFAELDN